VDLSELDGVLAQLPILQFLPPDVRELVVGSFVSASYTFGQEIVREGEPADALYVLVSGRARVFKRATGGEEMSLGAVGRGETFGEGDLLDQGTLAVTVRASGDVEVLRLDQSVVRALIQKRPEIRELIELQARRRQLQGFFREYSVFASLPAEAMAVLLRSLEEIDVATGETILREGDAPGPMYIIEAGRFRAHIGIEGRRRTVAYLRPGDFFGELSVLRGQPRESTVEAVTGGRLLRLTQQAFAKLLGEHPDFRRAIEDRIAQYDFRHTAQIPIDLYQELLPAEAAVARKVGADQIDEDLSDETGPAKADPAAKGPFADESGRFVKGGKRLRRFPHLWQIDEMDAGATALAIVCRHYGKAINRARIRQLVHTGLDGASLRAICQGASELGLAARSVKASLARLDQMPLPAIIHWEGNHWVVLYDVDRTHVRVSDPGVGRVRVSRDELAQKWTGYAALFDYTIDFERNEADQAGFRWLAPFFRPFLGLLVRAALLAMIVSALQLVIPVFTQVIVDRVLVEGDLPLLRILVIAMSVVVGVSLVGTIVERYLLAWVAVRIDSSSLDFLTRRLLSLPMSYFNTRRTGDIQRRLAGIWQIREFLVEHGTAALTASAQLLAALTLMLVYSPLLTLVFLATVPVLLIILRVSGNWLYPLYAQLEDSYGKYQSFQVDAIKGIETVKSLGAELAFRNLMLREFNRVARSRFRADYTFMTYQAAVHVTTLVSTILFLAIGARQVLDGSMSIGALVAFNALVALANGPIASLMSRWDDFQQATVYLDRLDDILQETPEQGFDRSGLLPVRSLEGRVTVRNLSFRYGGAESPVILDDLSFEVPPGTKVAVVGRSGSGKTTLIKILAGLQDPTEGAVLYDGIDLKTLNYRELRRRIGFVLQDNHLFDDSVSRNIAFGEAEPDLDQVTWAAEVASATEFIERLPLGYDTRIGESGLALSGGQRQRVAIARAVYNRPPILIFDEATSALDTESERAVKENIDQLLEGRTSFIIAHRLSTVRDADLILVLEKGRLVETGTHDDLMRRQGLYFFLVSQQLEI